MSSKLQILFLANILLINYTLIHDFVLEYRTILQAVYEVRLEHNFRETNITTHAFC
jgi:hypothetical protein